MALRGVSKVILVGNLSQDPEVRYMSNGDVGTEITLATSEAWRDKQTSENKEILEWHRVVLFESALGWRGSSCGKVRRSISRASCARASGWTRAVRVTMPQ